MRYQSHGKAILNLVMYKVNTQTVKCQTVYRHPCHTYLAYLQNNEIHYVHTYNKN